MARLRSSSGRTGIATQRLPTRSPRCRQWSRDVDAKVALPAPGQPATRILFGCAYCCVCHALVKAARSNQPSRCTTGRRCVHDIAGHLPPQTPGGEAGGRGASCVVNPDVSMSPGSCWTPPPCASGTPPKLFTRTTTCARTTWRTASTCTCSLRENPTGTDPARRRRPHPDCELRLTNGRRREVFDVRPVATHVEGPTGRRTGPDQDRPSCRRQPRRREPVGGGICELRIDYGPGYRVYYLQQGDRLFLLLSGGDKSTQDADITPARLIAQQWHTDQGGDR
jgi:hypothetical protein